jgi:hypothetical protein
MSKNHVGNVSSRTSGAHSPGRLPLPPAGHRKRPFRPFFWSWSKETFRSGPKAPFPSRVGRSVRQCPEMAVRCLWGVPDLLCFGETARKPPECHRSHVFMCLRCVRKAVELEISGLFWGSLSCLYLRVVLLDWVLLVQEQFSWTSIMDPVQRAAFQLSLHTAYPYPRLPLPNQEPFGGRSQPRKPRDRKCLAMPNITSVLTESLETFLHSGAGELL